jgi:predicted transcriptional regulator
MKLTDTVFSIMTSEVCSLNPNQLLLDVKHIFEKKSFHHHIPIVTDKKLVGMVSLIDFMRKIGNASLDNADPVYQTQVDEIMTLNPIKINANSTIKDAIELLLSGNIHALVVTNDKNEVVGMLSTKDFLKILLLVNQV